MHGQLGRGSPGGGSWRNPWALHLAPCPLGLTAEMGHTQGSSHHEEPQGVTSRDLEQKGGGQHRSPSPAEPQPSPTGWSQTDGQAIGLVDQIPNSLAVQVRREGWWAGGRDHALRLFSRWPGRLAPEAPQTFIEEPGLPIINRGWRLPT